MRPLVLGIENSYDDDDDDDDDNDDDDDDNDDYNCYCMVMQAVCCFLFLSSLLLYAT